MGDLDRLSPRVKTRTFHVDSPFDWVLFALAVALGFVFQPYKICRPAVELHTGASKLSDIISSKPLFFFFSFFSFLFFSSFIVPFHLAILYTPPQDPSLTSFLFTKTERQTELDDLESLAYMLLFLENGELPWNAAMREAEERALTREDARKAK